jgi:hypothetical protein
MLLSQVIENIQRGTWELVEDRRKHRADLKARTKEFIDQADADDCLFVLQLLIEQVGGITGDSSDLEDAEVALKVLIDEDGEDPLCAQCSGSGEGQHDGTRCRSCKGKGTISRSEK